MSKTKLKTSEEHRIDPSALYITDEPFEEGRPVQGSKYDEIFSKLQKNKRLVCPSGQASKISQGLRNWLARRGNEAAVVRIKERCKDGKGGVWWLDGERPSRAKTALPRIAQDSPFAVLTRKRKP